MFEKDRMFKTIYFRFPIISLLIFVTLLLSSCIRYTYATPPNFFESLERFDEIHLDRRSFSYFTPHSDIVVQINFIGTDEYLINIPVIRDTVAKYLMSNEFVYFIEERGLQHHDLTAAVRFWREEPNTHIVSFRGSTYFQFNNWSYDTVLTEIHSYLREFDTEHIGMGIDRGVFNSNELTFSFVPRFGFFEDYDEDIAEIEFAGWVLNVLNKMKSDIPNFVQGRFNDYLESLGWLILDEGYTITINLVAQDIPGPHYRVTTHIYETMVFVRTSAGTWGEQ